MVGVGVAVIATLALTVTLWPDQKKNDELNKKRLANGGANAVAENPAKRGPAVADNLPKTPASAPAKAPLVAQTKEIPNTLSSPPVQESIGTAYVRDPKTGEMKETTYSLKVMVVRTADGKPLLAKGVGSILGGPTDGGQFAVDPKVREIEGGVGSRPRDNVKK